MGNILYQYIKPELMILVPVLYAAGVLLKRSRVKDYRIPLILSVIGILLSTIWVVSTSFDFSIQGILAELFTGITQGILAAAVSVYFNQIVKQGQTAQACKLCEESKKHKSGTENVDSIKTDDNNTESKTKNSKK